MALLGNGGRLAGTLTVNGVTLQVSDATTIGSMRDPLSLSDLEEGTGFRVVYLSTMKVCFLLKKKKR